MAKKKVQPLVITRGKTLPIVVRWSTGPIIYKKISEITQTAPVKITTEDPHGMIDGFNCLVTDVVGMKEINVPANVRDDDRDDSDFHAATVLDQHNIEINDINACGFHAYVSGGILQYNTPVDLTGYKARDTIKPEPGVKNMLVCTVGGTSGSTLPTAAGADGTVTWSISISSSVIAPSLSPARTILAAGLSSTKQWFPNTVYAAGDVIDTEAYLLLTSDNGDLLIDTTAKTITYNIRAYDSASANWDQGYHELEMFKPGATPLDEKVIAIIAVSPVIINDESTN